MDRWVGIDSKERWIVDEVCDGVEIGGDEKDCNRYSFGMNKIDIYRGECHIGDAYGGLYYFGGYYIEGQFAGWKFAACEMGVTAA